MKRIIESPILQLITGSTLAQAFTLAFLPFISRIYSPETIGISGVFMNFAIIALSLVCFQYDQALYSTKDDQDIIPLKNLTRLLILASAVVLTFIYLGLQHYDVLGFRDLSASYAWLLFPLLLFGGFSKLGRTLSVKSGTFRTISRVTVVSSFSNNFLKTALGIFSNSVPVLLLCEITAQMTQFFGYYKQLPNKNGKSESIGTLKAVAKKYSDYSTYGQLSNLLDIVAMTIPLQFVTTLFGPAVAGIYIFSFRLVSVFNTNLGNAIADVFINQFSEFYRNRDYAGARHLFHKTVQKSFLMSLPLALSMTVIPPFAFGLFFGERWHDGGLYCTILVPWLFSGFVVSPVSNVLVILKKQRLKLVYDVVALTSSSLAFAAAYIFDFSILEFLVILSFSQVFSYVIYYLLINSVIRAELHKPHSEIDLIAKPAVSSGKPLTILVISYSNLKNDPRVHRQITTLKKDYKIISAGTSPSGYPDVEFIQLEEYKFHILEKLAYAIYLKLRFFETAYWETPYIKKNLDRLMKTRPDIVIANDIMMLPLALRVGRNAKVIFDAHEYAPKEFDDLPKWKFFFQQFYIYLCREYMPQAHTTTTVCDGIAQEFKKYFKVDAEVIFNAPPYHDLQPRPVNPQKIRVIHHGSAIPSRRIEDMIEMIDHLDERFEIDFMLTPSNPLYLEKLKTLIASKKRLRLLPPIPMQELPNFCNNYDVGLFLLKPVNFNYEYALPNKFFEYIQSRLAIAIGPSREMKKIIDLHNNGIVAQSFSPKDLAEKMNSVSTEKFYEMKLNSHRASLQLSFSFSEEKLKTLVKSISTEKNAHS